MNTNDALLRRLTDADPAPSDADLPLPSSRADLMAELSERLADQPRLTLPPVRTGGRWRGPSLSFAVFLLVLGAGFALRYAVPAGSRGLATGTVPAEIAVIDASEPFVGQPTSTLAPSTTQAPVPGGLDVRIETEIVPVVNEWPGPFRVTGPAVDAGIVCGDGERSLMGKDFGVGTWRHTVIFTCDDGSGAFELSYELEVSYTANGYVESGSWNVTWGSGAYENLTGRGTDHTTMTDTNHFVSVGIGQFALDQD